MGSNKRLIFKKTKNKKKNRILIRYTIIFRKYILTNLIPIEPVDNKIK